MNRRGIDTGFVLKLVFWMMILLIVFFLVKKYIVGVGTDVIGPAEGLLP